MSAEKFRVLVACIAILALVVGAFLCRYTFFTSPTERISGYLLDRWTGELTAVHEVRKATVVSGGAK